MLCLWIFIVQLAIRHCSLEENRMPFNVYYTDRVYYARNDIDEYYDCLYYGKHDDFIVENHFLPTGERLNDNEKLNPPQHVISYCIRSPYDKSFQTVTSRMGHLCISFAKMKENHVRSEDMLAWSAPIDLAERYQEFLMTANLFNFSSISMEQVFCNCTSPWFGPFCQYIFDFHPSTFLFGDVVKATYTSKKNLNDEKINDYTNLTCYVHIKCNRVGGICLDWREVCDGKIDCLDSTEDEENCFELERNECANDEYRCYNGMCVSNNFFRDDPFNPECLDGTDERNLQMAGLSDCYLYPSFRCEERTCRRPTKSFPCGDGECASQMRSLFIIHPYYDCRNNRGDQVTDWFFSQENSALPFDCWFSMSCLKTRTLSCDKYCKNDKICREKIKNNCPPHFFFPSYPIYDGHVRHAFYINLIIGDPLIPQYICYDRQRCPFLPQKIFIDGFSCVEWKYFEKLGYTSIADIFRICPIIKVSSSNKTTHCQSSDLYNCPGTLKCISKHRLVDGITDCFENYDEVYNESCSLTDKHRFPCSSDLDKCIKITFALDNRWWECEDDQNSLYLNKYDISFSTLCNGYQQMDYLSFIGKDGESDESNCEQWPCNNQYTRCDTSWTCLNGADEWNCPHSTCPYDHMPCVSPHTFKTFCLNISRIADNIIDCLGATDEQAFCRLTFPRMDWRYQCQNNSQCFTAVFTPSPMHLCPRENITFPGIDVMLQLSTYWLRNPPYSHFGIESLPLTVTFQSFKQTRLSAEKIETHDSRSLRLVNSSNININTSIFGFQKAWLCNRGILILKGSEKNEYCLCPPSYYGDRCQYQSDRISLTLQFHWQSAPEETSEVFGFVVTLIDDTNVIHSSDYFNYLSTFDCNTKFNRYLLYDSRARDRTKNYTVRVDAYNRVNLIHYASWILPVKFLSLPVNRIALRLIIPVQRSMPVKDCLVVCVYGYCTKYANALEQNYYCQCHSGWSGPRCTIPLACTCSGDSLCIGVTRNRPICLCPLTKLGPRCFLSSVCRSDTCKNGGVCVPADERISPLRNFTCVCQKGVVGMNCQLGEIKIDVSFSHEVGIPQSIITHFITVNKQAEPTRITMLKKIGADRDTVTLLVSTSVNLLFVQIQSNFYITHLQTNTTPLSSVTISSKITSSRQCSHIRQLFDDNRTIAYNLLRRVKYYHIPCKERPDLSCFYDEEQFMCLCNEHRHANCFKFDFNMTYNCWNYSQCENGAQCFRSDSNCLIETLCVCTDCYYGSKCQFSTKGSSLSLDAIFGYQIRPHLPISRQRNSVKVSITLSTLMFIAGLISGTLSLMTFRAESLREVGSGFYLLVASINSILTLSVFIVKFWFLLLAQMSLITNHNLLSIACVSVDFILRCLLSINDWLNACVAMERAITVVKGITFDKKKSKKMARWVVPVLILITIGSMMHDPIHRQLLNDKEEERNWCIVRYSPLIQIIDSTVNTIHFIVPFAINFVSAIVIIIATAQHHSTIRRQQSYEEHLGRQFHHLKHLIISPLVLVLLSSPRLVISFLTGCMKSVRDPWLFLTSYFISFMPPILIFVIYVLPSQTYKKEFDKVVVNGLQRYGCYVKAEPKNL